MGLVRRFWALSFNQKITSALSASGLLIGLGSLGAAIVAVEIASDSTDIKAAIGKLRILAVESGKQTVALAGQTQTLREDLAEQKNQTASLAKQAQSAAEQVGILADELGVSRQQLAIQSRNLALYEGELETYRTAEAQQFRAVSAIVTNIALPEKAGDDLSGTLRIENVGKTTLNVEDVYSSLIVTGEPIASATERVFAQMDRNPRKQSVTNMPPASGYNHINRHLPPPDESILAAVNNRGYAVIFAAEVISRDPFGNLHHDFACGYSTKEVRMRLCTTPPGD